MVCLMPCRGVCISTMFPVAHCCLLLPYNWEIEGSDSCDCLKWFCNFQVELEKLNAATDEINKLETELDESNTTFRMLLGEASRRLQALGRRLGGCVDKSRPYYDALDAAAKARSDCQKAAVAFQRASELHAAAKETVTLAEKRCETKQGECQFDSAWQEVLNHANNKVKDAATKKTESEQEHQRMATIFKTAERKVAQIEDSLKRHIIKSRLYFEEKRLCEEQLKTQKEKILHLQKSIAAAKFIYSQSLKALEVISEDIHRKRGEFVPDTLPVGPREPGVGAERDPAHPEMQLEDRSPSTSSAIEGAKTENEDDLSLQRLRMKVRELALKPIDGREIESDEAWARELNETINKLDHLLMIKESDHQKRSKFTTTSRGSSERASPDSQKMAEEQINVPIPNRWKSEDNLDKVVKPAQSANKELSRSMMSLDVVSLARDTAALDRESYLKAIIEDKSPTGTYTESTSDRNDTPDEILLVECDVSNENSNPVITMTSSPLNNN